MDGIVGILQFAIDGLSQQQQSTANNVSNADTPKYTAQEVDFESSLKQALDSPGGGTASVSTSLSKASPGTNGNNVDMPTEMTTLSTDTLQYQTMSEMLTSQFKLISDAMTPRG